MQQNSAGEGTYANNAWPYITRSSSREVGIRVPPFSVVYFSRETLQSKKGFKKGT